MNDHRNLRTAFALVGMPSCAKGKAVKLVFRDFCVKAGITMAEVPVSKHLRLYVQGLNDASVASQIVDDMDSGRLVSDKVTNAVFSAAVDEVASHHADTKGPLMVVVDGAPRTPGQIQAVILAVTNKLNIPVSGINVVHVSTPPHICAYRMGLRGRKDDRDENVVDTRFKEYFEKTAPAIQLLKKFTQGSSAGFHEINGQYMIDEAYSYQRKIFGPLWPEFFPGICRKIPFVV
jgi:adenylate kinase family enzyme